MDFDRHEITVRDGKGAKDRRTMLPASLKSPLQDHLRRVKAIHERDLANGWGRVLMPDALDRKYPNAPADWRWQWVFPQEHRSKNARTEGVPANCNLFGSVRCEAMSLRKARRAPGVFCPPRSR